MIQLLAKYKYSWDLSNPISLLSEQTYLDDMIYDAEYAVINKSTTSGGIYLVQGGLEVGKTYTIKCNLKQPTNGSNYNLSYGAFFHDGNFIYTFTGVGEQTKTFIATDTEIGVHLDETTVLALSFISVEEITYTNIDVLDEASILLNFKAFDVNDLGTNFGSYTKEITLPSTPSNDKFFKYVFNINEDAAFNHKVGIQASIMKDSSVYYDGLIYLEEVIRVNKDQDKFNYVVRFYSPVVGLYVDMADSELKDLDGSELDHTATTDLVRDTKTFPDNGLLTQVSDDGTSLEGKITYPLIDYGKGMTSKYWNCEGFEQQGSTPTYPKTFNNNTGYHVGDLYPAISTNYYWDKIFSEYGYSYSGDIFNTDAWKKLIIPFHNDQDEINNYSKVLEINSSSNSIYIRDDVLGTLGGTSAGDDGRRTFEPDTTWINDNGYLEDVAEFNYLNTLTTSTIVQDDPYYSYFDDVSGGVPLNLQAYQVFSRMYKVKRAGKHKLDGTAVFSTTPKIPGDPFDGKKIDILAVRIPKDNVYVIGNPYLNDRFSHRIKGQFQNYTVGNLTTDNMGTTIELEEQEFDCEVGDMLYLCWIRPYDVDYANNTNLISLSLNMKVYEENWGDNTPIEYEDFASKMKQQDFFKSILTMFNLKYITDDENPKHLKFYTRDDYYATGSTYDWSNKLDKTTEDYKVVTDIAKIVELSYSNSSDYYSKYYEESDDETYGTKTLNTGVQFNNDTDEISIGFQPAPISFKSGRFLNTKILSDLDNTDDNPNQGPRILIFNDIDVLGGAVASDQYYFFNNTRYIQWPYAGHFSNPNNVWENNITEDDYDINFDSNIIIGSPNDGQVTTKQNLYQNYWQSTIHHLINKNTRIKEAEYILDESDISSIKMNDTIFDNGMYYYILEINDFNPENKRTNVKLISAIDSTFTPIISGLTNTTTPLTNNDNVITKPSIFDSGDNNTTITVTNLDIADPTTDVIFLGDNNTAGNEDIDTKVIILGDSNISTGDNMIIGDYNIVNSDNTIIDGSNNYIPENSDVTIIGSNDIIVEDGVNNVVVIGSNGYTLTSGTTDLIILGDMVIEDGVIKSDGNIKEGGENEVQNPFSIDIINISDGSLDQVRGLPSYRSTNISDGGLNKI